MTILVRPNSSGSSDGVWTPFGGLDPAQVMRKFPGDNDEVWLQLSDAKPNNYHTFKLDAPLGDIEGGQHIATIRARRILGAPTTVEFSVHAGDPGETSDNLLGSSSSEISVPNEWVDMSVNIGEGPFADYSNLYLKIRIITSPGSNVVGFSKAELVTPLELQFVKTALLMPQDDPNRLLEARFQNGARDVVIFDGDWRDRNGVELEDKSVISWQDPINPVTPPPEPGEE